MFRSIYINLLLVAACTGSPSVSPRIIGGADASIQDFPYTASIEWEDSHLCGATILNADWVLTDAFCTFRPDVVDYAIRVGSSISNNGSDFVVVDAGTLHNVTEWIFHPFSDVTNREYDFALVKVDPPFEFNANVSAAALPALDQETPEGAIGVVTGWGQTSLEGSFGSVIQLQYANLTLLGDANCTSILGEGYNARTLCAEGVRGVEALCWHDEGGPLVVDGTLFGVVQWPEICADSQDVQLFSRVSAVRDWIDSTIGS